jgi:TfoX/Sxy family transcriptional regulator of competence genes
VKIPKSSERSEDLLRSLVPAGNDVSVRPMFGNLSAFVKGNMFMGVYGEDIFFRLSEADSAELLGNEGATFFEPMAGRQMKDYVVAPRSWRTDEAKLRPWAIRSLGWARKLPPKQKKR